MVINLVECLTFESPIERRSLEGGRREGMDEGGWRGEGGGGREREEEGRNGWRGMEEGGGGLDGGSYGSTLLCL
jgi:hypothetical protein